MVKKEEGENYDMTHFATWSCDSTVCLPVFPKGELGKLSDSNMATRSRASRKATAAEVIVVDSDSDASQPDSKRRATASG